MPKFSISTLVLIAVGFALVLAMTLLVFATRPQKFSITPEGVNNSAANEQRKLSIARLKRLMEEQDELISRKQADLTKLEAAFVSLDDPHSNVHGLRAPTGADIDRMIEHLAELTKAERRKALMSARPAPTVRALYEQLQATEQKLSTRLEEVSKDDSSVKSIELTIATMNEEIDKLVDVEFKRFVGELEEKRNRAVMREKALGALSEARRELQKLMETRQEINLRLEQTLHK